MTYAQNAVTLDSNTIVIRDVYIGAGTYTWTTPAAPNGYTLAYHRLACINGGNRGLIGAGGAAMGGDGGLDGGYQERYVSPTAMGATQTITAGAGSTSTADGGVTQIGSLLAGVAGTSAASTLAGQPVASPGRPGAGGFGGGAFVTDASSAKSTFGPGYRGQSAQLAAGGAGGQTNKGTGSNGGNVTATADPMIFSGGGGGGGGAGNSSLGAGSAGGTGGTGGAPGGGGGGSGSPPGASGYNSGTPGSGADGGACVWSYFIPTPTLNVT